MVLIGGVPSQAAAETPTPTIYDPDAYIDTTTTQPAGVSGVDLNAWIGYDGVVYGGTSYPLFVEITSKVFIEGELVVEVEDTSGWYDDRIVFAVSRPVEIAAGTTHRFPFTLTTETDLSKPRNVTVELRRSDGSFVAAEEIKTATDVFYSNNSDLVGVFPDLANRHTPERVPLSFGAGYAVIHPIDPADLNKDQALLQPFDMIVVTAADIRNLSETHLDLLLAWVNQGGHLLIDESVGTPIPGIPEIWKPASSLPYMAGQGEIVLTDNLARSGRWDEILKPAPIKSRYEAPESASMLFNHYDPIHNADDSSSYGSHSISGALQSIGDFNLPSALLIVIIVVAYIVLIGPVLWFVLKAFKRRELCWVVLPVVSFVFSVGLWGLGSAFRSGAETVHLTVVDVAPRGSTATSYLLLSPSGFGGGDRSVSQPLGWSAVPVYTEDRQGGHIIRTSSSETGSTATVRLDAGEYSVFGSSGIHTELDDTLQVTAELQDDGRVTGTVVNNLSVDLYDVTVYVNDDRGVIGHVPPNGGTRTFDSHLLRATTPDPHFDLEDKIGLWSELASSRLSLSTYLTGQVVVTAWTDKLDSPLDAKVGGGRTLLIARGEIEAANTTSGDSLIASHKLVRARRDLLPDRAIMLRFVLPEDAHTKDMVLNFPSDLESLEIWTGDGWSSIDMNIVDWYPYASSPARTQSGSSMYGRSSSNLPQGSLEDGAVVPLPSKSLEDGEVYVRVVVAASLEDSYSWGSSLFCENWRTSSYEVCDTGLRQVLGLPFFGVRSLRDDDKLSPLLMWGIG